MPISRLHRNVPSAFTHLGVGTSADATLPLLVSGSPASAKFIGAVGMGADPDSNAALLLGGTAQANSRLVIMNSTFGGSSFIIDQDTAGIGTINVQANAALNLATNNSTKLAIAPGGDITIVGAVGIGAAPVTAHLAVSGTSQATARISVYNSTWSGAPFVLDQDNSGNASVNNQAASALLLATNNSTKLEITSAGDIATNANRFSVTADGTTILSGDGNLPDITVWKVSGCLQLGPAAGTASGADGNSGIVCYCNTTGNTSLGEFAITPGLYLGISSDRTGTGTRLPIALFTNHEHQADLGTNGRWRWYKYTAGTITSDSSGNLTTSSDERMKHVLGPFHSGLDALRKIHPIFYRWREDSGMEPEGLYAGFSAQNVEEAESYAVGRSKENDMLSLQDRALLAMCVNAIQELDKKVNHDTDTGR